MQLKRDKSVSPAANTKIELLNNKSSKLKRDTTFKHNCRKAVVFRDKTVGLVWFRLVLCRFEALQLFFSLTVLNCILIG